MSFATQAEVDAGLEAYNTYLAEVWASKQAELQARLAVAAREAVEDEDRVQEVEEIEADFTAVPRLAFEGATDSAGRMKVSFALPGEGSWNLGIRARVRVLPWTSRGSILKLRIKRLRAAAELEIDRTSPIAATLVDTRVSVHLGGVRIDASNFLVRIFARGLTFLLELLEGLVERQIRNAAEDSLPDAEKVRALLDVGLASTPVEFTGTPTPLAELEDDAKAVAQRDRERHLPFDTLLNTVVSKSEPDGEAAGYIKFEDSAIWTGHFLTSEAYRHEVTGAADALENIRVGLMGLSQLIHLAGDDGLLSRVLIPFSEPALVDDLNRETAAAGHGERLFDSVDKKYRSIGHITRDQYIGAFLGAGWVALRVKDDEVSAQARDIALEMADYLVSQLFCPTEAVPDPTTKIKFTSVVYILNPVQILAILQLARHLDEDRFGETFEKFFPIWSVQWVFQWLQSIDPHDSYYKFNLEHAAALLLLTLEDNAERRAKLALGFRSVRQSVKFHANAYFNLVELAALGDDEAALSRPREEIVNETLHVISQAYQRPEFIETVDLSGDPDLDIVEIGGTARDDNRTEKVSRMPVDIVKRPGADFLWQRSPFSLRVVWGNLPLDPAMRSPNVDQTLPYWMARLMKL